MNVLEELKHLSVADIKDYCVSNTIDASVGMINIGGDFNLSTMVRNANFFAQNRIFLHPITFLNIYHL